MRVRACVCSNASARFYAQFFFFDKDIHPVPVWLCIVLFVYHWLCSVNCLFGYFFFSGNFFATMRRARHKNGERNSFDGNFVCRLGFRLACYGSSYNTTRCLNFIVTVSTKQQQKSVLNKFSYFRSRKGARFRDNHILMQSVRVSCYKHFENAAGGYGVRGWKVTTNERTYNIENKIVTNWLKHLEQLNGDEPVNKRYSVKPFP